MRVRGKTRNIGEPKHIVRGGRCDGCVSFVTTIQPARPGRSEASDERVAPSGSRDRTAVTGCGIRILPGHGRSRTHRVAESELALHADVADTVANDRT